MLISFVKNLTTYLNYQQTEGDKKPKKTKKQNNNN